jgi:predicted nucleotidyltransferase
MKIHDREVVVTMKGGSHMRNLNDESSDEDLKYFVLPTKEDLFTSKVYTNFQTSETVDIDIQDVRRLESLLHKSNPAYLDLLFSPEINPFSFIEMAHILRMNNHIARMNLPYLFDSCMGTMNQNVKQLQIPTSDKVKAMIEKHEYNPKKAMMAVHFANLLVRFHQTDFTDYKSAIWYEGEERDFMLGIKKGQHSLKEIKEIIAEKEVKAKELKDIYKSKEVDNYTLTNLQSLLRGMVFNSFKKGVI